MLIPSIMLWATIAGAQSAQTISVPRTRIAMRTETRSTATRLRTGFTAGLKPRPCQGIFGFPGLTDRANLFRTCGAGWVEGIGVPSWGVRSSSLAALGMTIVL